MNNLKKRCQRALENLLAQKPALSVEATGRLNDELAWLERTGWVGAMLEAADLTDYARNHGFGVGPGRGAVAGSLTAFLAGVTEIDPLEHGLLFERFVAGSSGKNAAIFLEVEPEGCQMIQGRQANAEIPLTGLVQVLPSNVTGTLFRIARRAFQSRPINEMFRTIPLNDPEVLRSIDECDTDALLTSPARPVQLTHDMRPRVHSFNDVITLMRFLHFPTENTTDRQSDGPRKKSASCPGLPPGIADLVADTHGRLIFQEQAMLVMNRMAGIPLPDAFLLLRKIRLDPESVRQAFVAGCDVGGYDPNETENAWELLVRETACACKAHLAGLAMTNYRMAFLRVRHPEAFLDRTSRPEVAGKHQ